MNLVNNYGTPNNIEVALRMKEFLGNDHGMLKYWGIDMNIFSGLYGIHGGHGGIGIKELREKVMNLVNHYRTPNMDLVYDRAEANLKLAGGRGNKNYNINKIKFFRDIPDGVEILVDYVDVTAIRTMNIPLEIIYESIYRELPELFEE